RPDQLLGPVDGRLEVRREQDDVEGGAGPDGAEAGDPARARALVPGAAAGERRRAPAARGRVHRAAPLDDAARGGAGLRARGGPGGGAAGGHPGMLSGEAIPVVPPGLLAKYDQPVPRYTSYPAVPDWSGDVTGPDWLDHLGRLKGRPGPMALYVHLPFCAHRCFYCGCNATV